MYKVATNHFNRSRWMGKVSITMNGVEWRKAKTKAKLSVNDLKKNRHHAYSTSTVIICSKWYSNTGLIIFFTYKDNDIVLY